jgi:hypothetical protein
VSSERGIGFNLMRRWLKMIGCRTTFPGDSMSVESGCRGAYRKSKRASGNKECGGGRHGV